MSFGQACWEIASARTGESNIPLSSRAFLVALCRFVPGGKRCCRRVRASPLKLVLENISRTERLLSRSTRRVSFIWDKDRLHAHRGNAGANTGRFTYSQPIRTFFLQLLFPKVSRNSNPASGISSAAWMLTQFATSCVAVFLQNAPANQTVWAALFWRF